MRLILSSLFFAILTVHGAGAQSVAQNLPNSAPTAAVPADAPVVAGDPYTVTDVNADVTADTAAHARDQALVQAQRTAFVQLCARFGAGAGVAAKLNDDAVAELVQSFEVQSEHLSAVRYIGIFTIRFNPVAVQRQIGTSITIDPVSAALATQPAAASGPISHVAVTIETGSLAAWMEIKRRLSAVPVVTHVEVLSLGRGVSHADLSYNGEFEDFQTALNNAGFVLLQDANGAWQLNDGSMVPR